MSAETHRQTVDRLSAGSIPIASVAKKADGARVLVLRAYRYWDFPKGMVDAGEAPLQAALRELGEETGLRDAHLAWGEAFYQTERYSHGKTARYYVGAVEEEPIHLPISQELGRPEHDETAGYPQTRHTACWCHGWLPRCAGHSLASRTHHDRSMPAAMTSIA